MAALADALRQRVLTLDIERLPGLAPVWDQKTRYIPAYTWRRMPSLLCFAAKWLDQRPVMFHAAWDDHDAMVQAAWNLLDEADILVGYNSKRFDVPHLKSAFVEAGMKPPSPWRNIDLFAVNKSTFGFESRSLDHLCRRLDVPGKRGHYDAAQAEAAMSGDQRSQAALARYNKQDVRATEAAYLALRPWITNHPHVGQSSGDVLTCPACGATDVERNGSYRAISHEFAAYRCKCGFNLRAGHVRRVARTRGVRDV